MLSVDIPFFCRPSQFTNTKPYKTHKGKQSNDNGSNIHNDTICGHNGPDKMRFNAFYLLLQPV